MRKVWVMGMAMVCLALTAAASGGAWQSSTTRQTNSTQTGQSTQQQTTRPSVLDSEGATPDPFKERMQEQASRGRNSERHRRLVADTDKLLQLSTELKVDVDKTTKDEMSVQVIQKAAEIEKLAHEVKERMKG